MNTRNFKCFQTVYEERNLQVAANKLFMSPQGLSKIIKKLEEDCKTQLFIRTKDGFVPTESGEVFYQKSKIIIGDLNEMFTAILAVNSREKRFRLGFAAGTIRAIDIPAMNRLMEEYPEIVAAWDEQENEAVLNRVLNDEINLGLVVGKPNASGLAVKLIKSMEIVLYVYKGHKFWDRDQVSIGEIKGEPLISMNQKFRIFHMMMTACHSNEFHPNIIGMVGDGETIHTLVKNQIGIGIVPKIFDEDEFTRGIPINDAPTWDVYGIYKENSPDSDLAKKIIDSL